MVACEGADVEINGQKGVPLADIEMAGAAPTEVVLSSGDTVILTNGDTFNITVEGTDTESLRFVRDAEVLQDLHGVLHGVPVAAGAHDHAHLDGVHEVPLANAPPAGAVPGGAHEQAWRSPVKCRFYGALHSDPLPLQAPPHDQRHHRQF